MKINHSEEKEEIKLSNTKFENLFVVDVCFGDEIVPFIFDTGASITAISKSVSKLIGAVPTGDSVIGRGNINTSISLDKSRINSCKIGSTIIENISVLVVNDENLDFGLDESGNRLMVNGFLGWDIIQNFKWTIDHKSESIIIEKSTDLIDIEGCLDWDNMPIIQAEFNNIQMFFGFDTGNTESMFSSNFIPFLNTDKRRKDIIAGVEGVSESEVFIAENIDLIIGDEAIRLNNISILERDIFPSKKYDVMGLLAADIIQDYKCVIDYPGKVFKLIKE